ncbi:AAA family ATPase [Armatimonas rosea]|uniref:Putative ATPase n=1 Tax=Armatimonas rosea TaxID=685828 RepID=A0A7W9W7V6_ARMRO|nr:putative ATPase [Armatimonas rosea]
MDWVAEKEAALKEIGSELLSPLTTPTLVDAADKALVGGGIFISPKAPSIPPLVAEPTFLAVDLELEIGTTRRSQIIAFEETACAALERAGGFLYRSNAGVEEGIRAVFATPEAACQGAVMVQQALYHRQWQPDTKPLLGRIGIYRGGAERLPDGYLGEAPRMAVRLMQAAQAGQVLLPRALTTTTEFPATVLGTHRLRDLSSIEELCQLNPPDVPPCTLPPRTLRLRQHNLPLEPNPLLGRATELASIRAILNSGRRLLTLTGPGGIGKTRLALQVAAELVEQYPDGVWFVPLAEVAGEDQLVTAIADAMGLVIRDSRVNFVEALAHRRALLVLDNFESVLDCAPRVAQLLRDAPGVVCLVTSQALLSLSGEWRFEVANLTPEEACQLFMERAHQANTALLLTTEDQRSIQNICERLERMPLAIELAAVRVRLFSLPEIERRLDDALNLLVTRARDVPERQRTLRGALEWSYNLLDSTERQYFLRLSIFPGSFLPDAASLVCEEADILEWLCVLEDKSLIRRESNGRWRMLSLVRQFAQEYLSCLPLEENLAQKGLISYCSGIAQNAANNLDSPREGKTFDILEADFELIRLSVDLLCKDKSEYLVPLLLNLDYFLRRRRYLREIENWCQFALKNIDECDSVSRGKLCLALFAVLKDKDVEESFELINGVIDIALLISDESLYAEALSYKGILLVREKAFDEALILYRIAMGIYERNNDNVRCVRLLNSIAQAKIRLGRFDDAEKDINDAIDIGRRIGCTRDLIVSMNSRGFLCHESGDYEGSGIVSRELVDLCLEMNDILPMIASVANYFDVKLCNSTVDIEVFLLIAKISKDIGDVANYEHVRKIILTKYLVSEDAIPVCRHQYDLKDLKGLWQLINIVADGRFLVDGDEVSN